jgi:hypothetical protein
MTRPHDDQAPPVGGRGSLPASEAERAELIAAELAALGEDPADDEELAFASTPAAAPGDLRTVATLVELAAWAAPAAGLSPLERHRIWQRVAKRIAPAAHGEGHGEHEHEPAANGGGSPWRGVLASLALVAGVALLLHVDVPPPPSPEDRAALESMGEATRAVLEATVPGQQDGARARALADGYAERFSAARGAER